MHGKIFIKINVNTVSGINWVFLKKLKLLRKKFIKPKSTRQLNFI